MISEYLERKKIQKEDRQNMAMFKKLLERKRQVLHFGKHKDKTLFEVPDGYLLWLLNDYDGVSLKRFDIVNEAKKRNFVCYMGEWTKYDPDCTDGWGGDDYANMTDEFDAWEEPRHPIPNFEF